MTAHSLTAVEQVKMAGFVNCKQMTVATNR